MALRTRKKKEGKPREKNQLNMIPVFLSLSELFE